MAFRWTWLSIAPLQPDVYLVIAEQVIIHSCDDALKLFKPTECAEPAETNVRRLDSWQQHNLFLRGA